MRWSRSLLTPVVLVSALAICLLQSAICNGQDTAADEKRLKAAKVDTDGPALLEHLRKRTRDADPEKIRPLIEQLGDDSYKVRVEASEQLVARGAVALPLLRQAVKSRDPEVARRATECLRQIEQDSDAPVTAAAARLLGVRKPDGAAEVLLTYLPLAEDFTVAEAVRRSLAAVAVKEGKADPALVSALTDKSPMRRTAAAEALCYAGAVEERPAIRKLLKDTDPTVRLAVGRALGMQKEKEAVPVLIDLLAELPWEEIWQAEEFLFRIADDKAPVDAPGKDEASRRKYRDAWAAWWKDRSERIDLAQLLDGKPRLRGFTMVILLDKGQIVDLDHNNKERWKISDLGFPLDAQLLPGERVLVAENKANRVTERSRTGEILWQVNAEQPLVAQRLANGNTFIGTPSRLFEVDRSGKEVFTYSRPAGEQFMKMQKLDNGDIAYVTEAQRFVRMDATGKERAMFAAAVNTSGGRIDVLPDGGVLVPMMANNRVIEYDARGQVVWQVSVEQPVAAVRLPNGNTLITTYHKHRAIEVDKAGKEVWNYSTDTRVTRAWRR